MQALEDGQDSAIEVQNYSNPFMASSKQQKIVSVLP
jgi:hypothetical protein